MPGGWGRRAAGNLNQKLEEDNLFKEIGGQLEASNFDYSQWQRTKKVPKSEPARRPPPPQHKKDPFAELDRPFTVQSIGNSSYGDRIQSAASTCRHGKSKKETPMESVISKKKAEAVKILQLRIRARRQTIAEYKKRQVQLLEENMKLRDEIDSQEGAAHEAVKKLLRKYEKFRGGIATLNDQFQQDLRDAKDDLEETQRWIQDDISGIEAEVTAVDTSLKAQQQEMYTLANYKDKEYPVKALRISDLQKELANLKVHYEDEENDLQRIIDNEIEKMKKERNSVRTEITEKATKDVYEKMHPSLKDMGMQNMVMGKEIEFNKNEIEELEQTNKALQAEVKRMMKDPKTDIRQQMFPEFFPKREKCTPDMDIVLDIPTQEWLPI